MFFFDGKFKSSPVINASGSSKIVSLKKTNPSTNPNLNNQFFLNL